MRAHLKLCNIALFAIVGVAQKIAKLRFALVGLCKERCIVLGTDKGMHVACGEAIFKLDLRAVITELHVGDQQGVLCDGVRNSDNEEILPYRNDLAADKFDRLFWLLGRKVGSSPEVPL